MDSPQQTAHAAGKAASASVARMQAKAAQLAEELRLAQAQSSSPLSSVATGTLERTHTACPEAYTEAGSPKPSVTALSAPSVFRRLSAASAAATKPAAQSTADPTYQAVALQCQKLEAEVQLWKTKHAEAIKEIDRHQDSYMRREEQLKAQLAAVTQPQDATAGPASSSADSGSADAAPRSGSGAAYESESGGSGGSTAAHKNRGQKQQTLQDMQQQVLEGLDELLQRQRLQMRTEESQQLRQFRGRLVEIEAQLAAYRQAAAASQDDWMGKTVALREELGVTQDIASKLDAMYKLAEQEAAHLRVQFKAQEDDRQLLIRQILGLKRENAKLKQEQAALQDELDQIMALALEAEAEPLTNHVGSPWPAAGQRHGRQAGPSNSSSLAAAIAEVVERRGSTAGTSSRPQSASVGSRPQTASQQSRLQQQQHQARPQSAAPNGQQQQHSHSMGLSGHTAAGAVGNVPNDPAAVEARMIRYSHVIQKLQKLLKVERRQLRQVRNSYNAELSKRTELQTLLLDSIESAKQQQRDAETAYQQSQLPQQQGLESRPRSAARAAGSVSRPASAALGIRQLAYHSRPDSPAAGGRRPGLNAAAGAFESQQLDQAAWENLLADLLAQRQVLELLFKQAFPDFVAEADELFSGSRELHGEHLQQPQQQPEELAKQLASRQQQHRQQTLDQAELQQPEPWRQQQQQEATLGLTERPDSASSDSPGDIDYLDSEGSSGDRESAETSGQHGDEQQAFPGFSPLGADVGSDAGLAEQSQQGYEQQIEPSSQQHEEQHAPAQTISGPVLPSFPRRQPLHHTRLQRPVSAQPAAASRGSAGRPSTAMPAATRESMQWHSRPQTAIGSLHGSSPVAVRGPSSKTPPEAFGRNSRRPATASAAVRTSNTDQKSGQTTNQQWNIGADKLMESFLSGAGIR